MSTHAPHSRYARASYSLTNNRDALRLYREMAEKTNSPEVQLSYAKYLLEIASLYDTPENNPQKASTFNARRPSIVRDTSHTFASLDSRLSGMMKRGRASLHRPTPSTGGDLSSAEKRREFEDEAVRWVKRLAREGHPEAAYMYATWIDAQRYGLRPNPPKAFRLYEVAAAHGQGKPEAMLAAGKYLEAQGDAAGAVAHYKAAAERGLVAAVHRMAQVHLHGQLDQRQNMTTGLALLAQAAQHATDAHPESPFMFGQVLANTYPRADIPSELVLPYGGAHAAPHYWERAAAWGHPEAMTEMGWVHEHGLYEYPVDLAKAFNYYDKAAHHQSVGAMLGLSRLYNGGFEGPDDEPLHIAQDVSGWLDASTRNEDEAFRWCRRAVEQDNGFDKALYLLG